MFGQKSKMIKVGWREWCALPSLQIPAIKIKIDTGARTSALHAFDIRLEENNNKQYVHFSVYPIQGDKNIVLNCSSLLKETRMVTSSNGHRELRYIIMTSISLGKRIWEIELSLSNRDPLKFRMLLGREALKHIALIDPSSSYCQGHFTRDEIKKKYY